MNSLIGLWFFTSMIYNNSPLPPPNPDLVMSFQFESNGENTLHYYRKNEEGFCERKAHYVFDGASLYQKVFWLHPDNAYWCGNDPDMRLGTEGTNVASISDKGEFHLELNMGDEVITMVWTKPDVDNDPAE